MLCRDIDEIRNVFCSALIEVRKQKLVLTAETYRSFVAIMSTFETGCAAMPILVPERFLNLFTIELIRYVINWWDLDLQGSDYVIDNG